MTLTAYRARLADRLFAARLAGAAPKPRPRPLSRRTPTDPAKLDRRWEMLLAAKGGAA